MFLADRWLNINCWSDLPARTVSYRFGAKTKERSKGGRRYDNVLLIFRRQNRGKLNNNNYFKVLHENNRCSFAH